MAAPPELLDRMTLAAAPLSLDFIEPTAVSPIQRLLQRHGPGSVAIEGQEIRFAWSDVQLGENRIAVTLASGPHSLQVELDNCGALDPLLIGEPFDLLPPALRALVVRKTIASLLINAPRALAESLQVTEVRWHSRTESDWPIKLGFRLQRGADGCVTHGTLATRDAATLSWLDELLPASSTPPRVDLQSLPIPIRLVLGRSAMSTTILRRLEVGDVVWVQSARLTRNGIHVDCRIGALSAALATVRHRQLQLGNLQALTMKQQQPAAQPASPAQPVTLDARTPPRTLEVPVTFDAGELELPLSQLERLQPGAVLELPQDVSDATIQLRVGNSLIARGVLVAIGKRLGVRITHVYLEETPPHRAGSASP